MERAGIGELPQPGRRASETMQPDYQPPPPATIALIVEICPSKSAAASYSALVLRPANTLVDDVGHMVLHMQRLLASNLGILGSYVALVAAVSLLARWQILLPG
ncbi:MAG: hypothetical protein M3N26_03640 [Pseudomonadota bacterium]|nr:hypothetical protein [Pseudomonadota bacterium]